VEQAQTYHQFLDQQLEFLVQYLEVEVVEQIFLHQQLQEELAVVVMAVTLQVEQVQMQQLTPVAVEAVVEDPVMVVTVDQE
jgi:hypothetical protein|tara:strand:+ start:124 stop:366 length:243 start_codon:yes stop_codon:yes gene_type:complete